MLSSEYSRDIVHDHPLRLLFPKHTTHDIFPRRLLRLGLEWEWPRTCRSLTIASPLDMSYDAPSIDSRSHEGRIESGSFVSPASHDVLIVLRQSKGYISTNMLQYLVTEFEES